MSLNKLLNNLKTEVHIPGYKFCGPGTKLAERLARGDIPINRLDEACLKHDLEYSQASDRREADLSLEKKALERVFSRDARIGERIAALGVVGAMKLKRKVGGGVLFTKKNKTMEEKRKKVVGGRKKKGGHLKKKTKKNRVIPVPEKMGGVVPMLPLIAGVGALASIAKLVNDVKTSKGQLAETARHNKYIEAIAARGKGFRLRPWGYGLKNKKKKNSKRYPSAP